MLAPTACLATRHEAARHQCAAAGVDALVVSHLPNVFYLTNLASTAGVLVLTGTAVTLIVDGRYRGAAETLATGPSACPGLEVRLVTESYEESLTAHLSELRGLRVGLEAAHTSVARQEWLLAALAGGGSGPELVSTQGVIESLRVRKDTFEQGVLRDAARRLSAVVIGVLADLRAGLREWEVAAQLELALRRAGFSKPAFDTIVASGPSSAAPHARAGDRTLAAGDLVVMDVGGVYHGYCVDITRMAAVAEPPRAARDLFDAVLAAQAAGLEAVRPGTATADVDAAARAVLTERGYGDAFVHSTGHGLGLEVHEAPRLARRHPQAERAVPRGHFRDPEVLAPGMVVTVEPGAYLPGFGGVRVEDDVLVTKDGREVLTTVDRALVVC
jgi:Xaa-Pro aminopeptidase